MGQAEDYELSTFFHQPKSSFVFSRPISVKMDLDEIIYCDIHAL